MSKEKLIVVIMGPGKKHFAEMCIDSVKDADKILYWTSSNSIDDIDGKLIKSYETNVKHEVHFNGWDESDKATNGKCRNRYLEHLKKEYPEDWCIVLDEDELVEDLDKIKEFIQVANPGIYNVKMRHLIGNLGWEDNTNPIHVVPGRLFKISEAIKYPEHSHPVLEGNHIGNCMASTIWHLGHCPILYLDYILTRYKQHAADSQIHTPEFLKSWKMAHLLGQYPVRQVNPVELPQQILDRYELSKDEFYFANRGLELKHMEDAIHWKDFFKCKTAVEFGCGKGPRVYAMNHIGIDSYGIELSKFAVDNKLDSNIYEGDVINYNGTEGECDLVVAYDLLEHINYEDLDKAIITLKLFSQKHLLISVPVIGDPNLEADPTHIIRETKEWWVKQFNDKGLKLIKTPEHFLFKEQLMIFEK